MYDADFILIIMTLALYVYAFVQVICRCFRHNRTSNTKNK
jgi:hypothetical protein